MTDKTWKDNSKTKEIIEILKKHDSVVIYDLETTGISRKKDRILQFSAIRYRLPEFEEMDRRNIFIKCPFSIPEELTKINHIDDELLEKKGIEQPEAFKDISNFIKEDDFIAGYNNNSFDDVFMENLYQEYEKEFKVADNIDIYKYVKTIVPPDKVMHMDPKSKKMKPSYKLEYVMGYYDPENTIKFHDAIGDVSATAYVFKMAVEDGKKYVKERDSLEESRKEITRKKVNILSINLFAPTTMIQRVYVNTDQGVFYYDDIKHIWQAKSGNIASIDVDSLIEDSFKLTGTTNETDFFKAMKKIRAINNCNFVIQSVKKLKANTYKVFYKEKTYELIQYEDKDGKSHFLYDGIITNTIKELLERLRLESK